MLIGGSYAQMYDFAQKRRGEASKRKRGQQPGAPGHGRTPRPRLDETEERLDPPEDARTCSSCGEPYVANGSRESEIIEIEVKAHRRKIVRPRWRRGCGCASSPSEVAAEPPARLFPARPSGPAYGRMSCTSASRACARAAASRPGYRPWAGNLGGDAGRRHEPRAARCPCSSRCGMRSSITRTRRGCATPTRPAGGSRP